jgi:hypothetical protein
MALLLRYGFCAVALGMMLFCISCEKHPLDQMPEVQREQPDPATRVWTEETAIQHEGPKSAPMHSDATPEENR